MRDLCKYEIFARFFSSKFPRFQQRNGEKNQNNKMK